MGRVELYAIFWDFWEIKWNYLGPSSSKKTRSSWWRPWELEGEGNRKKGRLERPPNSCGLSGNAKTKLTSIPRSGGNRQTKIGGGEGAVAGRMSIVISKPVMQPNARPSVSFLKEVRRERLERWSLSLKVALCASFCLCNPTSSPKNTTTINLAATSKIEITAHGTVMSSYKSCKIYARSNNLLYFLDCTICPSIITCFWERKWIRLVHTLL